MPDSKSALHGSDGRREPACERGAALAGSVPAFQYRSPGAAPDQAEERRAAKAEAEGQHYVFVQDERTSRYYWCLSTSGEVYEVTLLDCNCPDHEFRCRAAGIRCKHRIALETAQQRGAITTF